MLLRALRAAAALAAAVLAAPLSHAVEEQGLKAAIVVKLLDFVEWPAAHGPAGDLVLCVDPASALAPPLRLLHGLALRQWRLAVRSAEPGKAAQCHVLVVDSAAPGRLRPRESEPVLVIGSGAPQPDDGVHLHLVPVGGRIGFEVSLAQARRAGLQISSRLLRLAQAVHE